jgi:hypothetical protein
MVSLASSWPAAQTTASHDDGALLHGILKAQTRVYDVCKETQLQYAPRLSLMLNNRVYIKREDQQPVFSQGHCHCLGGEPRPRRGVLRFQATTAQRDLHAKRHAPDQS